MSAPLSVADTVELATVTRGGVVESRHLGALAVVDASGELIASLGETTASIYPRSSLKPFQAIASLRAGAELDGERLALACASHVGSRRHQELAAAILTDAGLGPEDLRCPTAWPRETEARNERIRAGEGPDRLAFNCSGKHAGFLSACVAAGWDTASYLDPQHPLQRLVMDTVAEFAGADVGVVAVDGCGAPVPQLPLVGLARATARLLAAHRSAPGTSRPEDVPAAAVVRAMLGHAWAVHGHGAENTVVMEELGVLAKLGAEGVLILGAPDGTALALKLLDGSSRAATAAGLSALVALGVLDAEPVAAVLASVLPPVLGGGEPVGALTPTDAVTTLVRS